MTSFPFDEWSNRWNASFQDQNQKAAANPTYSQPMAMVIELRKQVEALEERVRRLEQLDLDTRVTDLEWKA